MYRFLGSNIVGNIQDYERIKLDKIFKSTVVLRHLNAKCHTYNFIIYFYTSYFFNDIRDETDLFCYSGYKNVIYGAARPALQHVNGKC